MVLLAITLHISETVYIKQSFMLVLGPYALARLLHVTIYIVKIYDDKSIVLRRLQTARNTTSGFTLQKLLPLLAEFGLGTLSYTPQMRTEQRFNRYYVRNPNHNLTLTKSIQRTSFHFICISRMDTKGCT